MKENLFQPTNPADDPFLIRLDIRKLENDPYRAMEDLAAMLGMKHRFDAAFARGEKSGAKRERAAIVVWANGFCRRMEEIGINSDRRARQLLHMVAKSLERGDHLPKGPPMPSEPSSWAMKAARACQYRLLGHFAEAELMDCASIIESAWEEQNSLQKVLCLADGSAMADILNRDILVSRLVAAAKYAITTNDWKPGPGTRRGDLREALAALDK